MAASRRYSARDHLRPIEHRSADSNGAAMSRLTLVSVTPALAPLPASQWAHDIRNALTLTSLHLETLERLSGSVGRKAASAAQAVMKRAAEMCSASLAQRVEPGNRRRRFDLIQTIKEIVAVLEPVVPDGFEIRIPAQSTCMVVGDPGDVYRIIFNLVQNAVTVARDGGRISHVNIAIAIAVRGPAVAVQISDDGPGLPKSVRSTLFRQQAVRRPGGNGLGIAIARELAERNGATLRLADCVRGTSYVFELAGLRDVAGVQARVS
jgi:two-component system OmpR family sensor kinase/two-component system sensor histidine kinase QseC